MHLVRTLRFYTPASAKTAAIATAFAARLRLQDDVAWTCYC